MKTAVISVALPPSQSGQSIVLYHLLKEWDPKNYCLITKSNIHGKLFQRNCSQKLPAKYFFLQPDIHILQRIIRLGLAFHLDFILNIVLRMRILQIKKILMKESCDYVVACTGDLFDPPAAFFASKELGIPFILYTFDYYSQQWTEPHYRLFAEQFERHILTDAHRVIVPNECMEKEYHDRYGIQPVVIHNPFDLKEYEQDLQRFGVAEVMEACREIRIVYTGAIYDAHYSAFRNIVEAIRKTGNPNIFLHIYTSQSPAQIREHGIEGPVRFHEALPNREIPQIQRSADLLFLPLTFHSNFPDVIRTSAPGKIGEYLASGRPVLVHAPKDTFVSRYFRRHACGYVVDEDNPTVLAGAINNLIQDEKLRRELSGNALIRAKMDFDILIAREKFEDVLGNNRG